MFPIPPRMTMIRTRIDVENVKKSDVGAPRYDAWSEPATPAKLAPRGSVGAPSRAPNVPATRIATGTMIQNGRWMPGNPGATFARKTMLMLPQWDDARNAAVYAPRA